MRCGRRGFDWDRRAKRIVGRSALLAVFVVGVDLKRRDFPGEQTPSFGIPIDFVAEQRVDGREFVVEGENVVLQLDRVPGVSLLDGLGFARYSNPTG
jgi:hypothetical protein